MRGGLVKDNPDIRYRFFGRIHADWLDAVVAGVIVGALAGLAVALLELSGGEAGAGAVGMGPCHK